MHARVMKWHCDEVGDMCDRPEIVLQQEPHHFAGAKIFSAYRVVVKTIFTSSFCPLAHDMILQCPDHM